MLQNLFFNLCFMKKTFLIIAVLLFVGAAVSGAFAGERFMSASESLKLSDEQFAKANEAEAAGNLEEATSQMEYSDDNAANANDAKTYGYAGAAGAGVLVIAGVVLLIVGRKEA